MSLKEKIVSLTGRILQIRFADPQSFWATFSMIPLSADLETEKTSDVPIDQKSIQVVGTFAGVELFTGLVLTVEGVYFKHEKFGFQLQAKRYFLDETDFSYTLQARIPSLKKEHLDQFLKLGKDVTQVLENNTYMKEFDFSEKVFLKYCSEWVENHKLAQFKKIANDFGLEDGIIYNLTRKYGVKQALKILESNPYQLAVDGILPLSVVEKITKILGNNSEKLSRSKTIIETYLKSGLESNGNTVVVKKDIKKLINSYCDFLKINWISDEDFDSAYQNLLDTDIICENENLCYHREWLEKESFVSQKLLERSELKNIPIDLVPFLKKLEKENIILNEDQISVLHEMQKSECFVLSGPAGSGKTFTINAMVKFLKSQKKSFRLMSPTGKAAKRLQEMTGEKAFTIHRFFKADPEGDWGFNEDKQIKHIDYIILDECSMISTNLFYNFLKALPDTINLVLCGDINQLQAVGAGKIFKDLVESERINRVILTKVLRQSETSGILKASQDVLNDTFDMSKYSPQLRFINVEDSDETERNVLEFISGLFKNKKEFQVISPQNINKLGTRDLNYKIKDIMNPDAGVSFEVSGNTFKLKDKVIVIQNNYDLDVYNGDIGYVSNINLKKRQCFVTIEDREIKFKFSEIAEHLQLAYALSTHKIQGSEFDIVIFPCVKEHQFMLNKNLIYTTITRAKKYCFIFGDYKTFLKSLSKNDRKRNTLFSKYLKGN